MTIITDNIFGFGMIFGIGITLIFQWLFNWGNIKRDALEVKDE